MSTLLTPKQHRPIKPAAKPDNVPYYRSFGFVEIGRETLPRGASLWLMLRPHS